MIRFIFVVIFVVLFLIITAPVRLVMWLLHKSSPQTSDICSLRIVQWAFRSILRITGVRTTVIGEENVPDEPSSLSATTGVTSTSCSPTADADARPAMWQKKKWKNIRDFLPGCAACTASSLTGKTRRKD